KHALYGKESTKFHELKKVVETKNEAHLQCAAVGNGQSAMALLRRLLRPRGYCPLPNAYCLRALPLQVDEFVQHLVGRRDDLRGGRVGALGHDEVRELFRQVDGGGFERLRLDRARAADACAAHGESAGAGAEAIDATMFRNQAVLVAEG